MYPAFYFIVGNAIGIFMGFILCINVFGGD